MTMIEFISWIQREEEELVEMLENHFFDDFQEVLIVQGRLEEVRRIIRKLTRTGVL